MKIIKYAVIAFFIPHVSFAFFCPNNFNQINYGDAIEQVNKQCGKPDKEVKSEKEPPVPQEWTYYVPQTVQINGYQQGQGTLKTSIAFDKEGKAINISVNGIGVGATTLCNNMNIQLGSTRDQVKAACGEPANVDKQTGNTPDATTAAKKVITYTYNSNPPQKLIFEDGVLTSKE